MQMPWSFELLALGPDADERAVKRAYAVRLKQVDPGADPVGFARLREAYEHARAWVAHQAAAAATGDTAATVEPAPVQPPPLPLPASAAVRRTDADGPETVAMRLIERFARRVKYGEAAHIAAELQACAAALRREHIDAPFLFERYLIDALASAGIRRRPAVFVAAYAHFGWHEYMHLASLGPAGGWIDSVEQQRQRFETLDPVDKADIRTWLSAHGEGSGPIPDAAALAWPRIRDAIARFPRYLALYISEARAQAWQARFEAADSEQRRAASGAEPYAVRRRTQRGTPRRAVDVRVWVALCAFVFWAMHGILASSQRSVDTPGATAMRHVPGRTEAERTQAFDCMRLVDQIDAPGTLPTVEQAAQAHRCHALLERLQRESAP
ncbi:hypothetical protein [Luteibacter yeojuensis]|uniref:J domain-containing protein n=1 Tax=Luteibacter yeojuensis TaxID=345309 RepID=A0A0F3L1V8_9GAMM|nr:hypothetical protein [Luteibacter yeojuensis]KJV37381.1 hypothetical protein VI08_00800 [Luteibacter yeojuensis]